MKPESKNRNDADNHHFVSVSKGASSQKGPEKIGLLKRFFDWITKGTDKSRMGKASCPT
jgi:hypothetical protein